MALLGRRPWEEELSDVGATGRGRSLRAAARATSGDLLKMTGRYASLLRCSMRIFIHRQLWLEGGYGPVAWSYAPSHDWQSGEHLVTAFEIDEQNVRAQDVDEIVVTFVYMQLRQERDVRRY